MYNNNNQKLNPQAIRYHNIEIKINIIMIYIVLPLYNLTALLFTVSNLYRRIIHKFYKDRHDLVNALYWIFKMNFYTFFVRTSIYILASLIIMIILFSLQKKYHYSEFKSTVVRSLIYIFVFILSGFVLYIYNTS